MITSLVMSLTIALQVSKSHNLLTAGDIQQRNYPELYHVQQIVCSFCSTVEYLNTHPGFCPAHLQDFNERLAKQSTN
ncbi:unnamed protein product [Rhizophagus irregularis]|nr:unnamed protein product [Rhizophagus irregularis]